ncbi:MAG: Uma2 family endonuclease [Dermatophilus congolensis]|nr:Uma2 family endonuclease [Dermatophilus congolensis]
MSTTSRPPAHGPAAAREPAWLPAGRGQPVTQNDLEATPWYGKRVEAVDGAVHISPFTRVQRDELPDDGRRHELLDGTLVMSPSPTRRHQRAVFRLGVLLDASAPPSLEVFVAPCDVVLADTTVVEPDAFVTLREDLDSPNPSLPLLVIEVLSPSTRRVDLGAKKNAYEAAGIADYWVVDPDDQTITAWQLDSSGRYREVTRAAGEETFSVSAPFELSLTPSHIFD